MYPISNRNILTAIFFVVFLIPNYSYAIEPKITTYQIVGNTVDALIEQLNTKGPNGAWGHTDYTWKSSWNYDKKEGKYGTSDVDVKTSVAIQMPNWPGYKNSSVCIKASWDKMYSQLKQHEEKHVSLGANVATEMKSMIEGVVQLSSTDNVDKEVNRIIFDLTNKNKKEQAQFDAETNNGQKSIIFDQC